MFLKEISRRHLQKGELETAFSIPTEWEINASVTFN